MKEAPFTGNLIEFDDIRARNGFARTVMQLVHAGELPADARCIAAGGTFLLTTLDREQIADVHNSVGELVLELAAPDAEPVGALNRPRNRRISDEKKLLIRERLVAGVAAADVAREMGLPYQSVYYYVSKALRVQRQAEAGD